MRRMLMPWENDENGHKSILHTEEIFGGVHAREREREGEIGQLLGVGYQPYYDEISKRPIGN